VDFDLTKALLFYVVLLVSLVTHEAAHAWLAHLGGDDTAYAGGQVTLNPVPHIRREPFGTVVLPLLSLWIWKGQACMGFAHAPFDPVWARMHPRRAALTAAAGPLANLALAGIAFLAIKLLVATDLVNATGQFFEIERIARPLEDEPCLHALCRILSVFLGLNVLLATLNLYPIPPLDGAGVLEGLFPRLGVLFDFIRSQPFLLIACMVGVWYTMGGFIWPVLGEIVSWL
jgi:Zn-dependent protease